MEETTLKQKTAKGLFWGGISNGVQQLLNAIIGIVLGQVLTPTDFGMTGVLVVFAAIAAALQECGVVAGITQQKNITQAQLNAIFYFNIAVALFLYCILFFCSPWIAAFFGQPNLVWLARILFLGFVCSSFGNVPRAILFRNMQVKETAKVGIFSVLISGSVGIALAYLGLAYWGIAIQSVSFCACVTLLSGYFSRWRPTRTCDGGPLRHILNFGSKQMITEVCFQINNNLFSLILGRRYRTEDVGYYTQGNKWTSMGSSLIWGMVQGVAQPTFVRLQTEPERAQRAFGKLLRFTAFFSFPALFGIALIAQELIGLAFPAHWLPAADMMQILCIGGAFFPIAQLYANCIMGHGRSDIYMYNAVTLCLLQLLLLILFSPLGIKAMLYAYVGLNIAYLSVWHFFLYRTVRYSLWQALRDILPFAVIAAGVMLCTQWITGGIASLALRLVSKVLIAILLYSAVMYILRVRTFSDGLAFVLSRFRGGKEDL